ncbi:hypothetical protein MLD38_009300 [Melastoma candidum]|uniref:Uncharacterized protein n=1 Tax=Melastoma candidum TaxID=119954 RepID=A0ACB9S058_9MYRT|nr:hypothetical protein MLD38_009300 [Melastoma candidum]
MSRVLISALVVIFFVYPSNPLKFSIPRFDQTLADVLYEGDAHPDVGNVDMTDMTYYCHVGRVTYNERLRLWDSSSGRLSDFITHFAFTIDMGNRTNFGDGFAFFMAPVGFQIPVNSIGWFPGLYNTTYRDSSRNQIIHVEFDPYGASSKKSKRIKIATGVSTSIVLLILVLFAIFVVRTNRKRKNRMKKNTTEAANSMSINEDLERQAGPRRYAYKDLASATNNFSSERKLGEGGFGSVYKGYLLDLDIPITVKKFSRGSRQGKREFITEVKVISSLRHRNLVQLIGWCHDRNEFLLVFEFMPNGSLDTHLFGKRAPLTWLTRYKISLGLASALLYLHEEWEQCVIHRDIKSSNVMLDLNFNVKLGISDWLG